jgi:pyruvate,water dikinase
VRSSGTAEDLEGASFAGLHDTYLDVTTVDGVLDAVRRCWASLWTARAVSYRQTKGFGQTAAIAVVVQQMVASEVAGVMFTANPLTAATDEVVINASWGLGEAIVAGITTPDEYVLNHSRLRVTERTLGSKEKQVVRDPQTGRGTVVEDVPDARREAFTLSDAQAQELAALGLRVQRHYGDFPQDTEWALADGAFYLLQARPVTGVDLSWDADVDAWQILPDVPDDTVWTRAWTDSVWCGGISPLMYSVRAWGITYSNEVCQSIYGQPDIARTRMWKYHRGGAYYNCTQDRLFVSRTAWPSTRPGMLDHTPPAWQEEVLGAPFSVVSYLKMQARMALLDRSSSAFTWLDESNKYLFGRVEEANGLPDAELPHLSDEELKRYIDELVEFEAKFIATIWTGFFVHARDSFAALATMVAKWYDGGNATAFTDIITGVPRPTATMIENHSLWSLAQGLRESPELSRLFAEHEDGAFFAACAQSEDGRAWLEDYERFLAENGHRGHEDRDLWYARRAEDPGLDYRSLKAFLSTVGDDPQENERRVEARRQEMITKVADNMRAKPLGALRANLFRMTLDYVDKFLMFRDDERYYVDRVTFSIKRGFKELNRRLVERGVFDNDEDYFMLTREELYALLDGRADLALIRAKIAPRMRNFVAVARKESTNPLYLQRGRDVDLEFDRAPGEELPDGLYVGIGTSGGTVEGTARVIKELKEIGRVLPDEILVTNSTDPGWTPVFSVINAIVLETGGLLAHGSCLAREYGMPAVQLPKATKLIPDGARIRINGDAGTIEVLEEPEADGAELAAVASA